MQPVLRRTNGASLPMDQCCLVVQMPSVDEMKREVADITCQMQSVYCSEEAPCIQQRPVETSLTDVGHGLSSEDDEKKSLTFRTPTMRKFSTLSKLSPMTTTTTPERGSDWRPKSNTISKMTATETDVLEPTPKQTSISSSLPREEQVSEEFVINGRRYRQTYHRRVVLERRTTRDVFFLPATTSDSGIGQNAATTLEYTSPRFIKSEEDPCRTVAHPNGADASCRPRLDLTVIHNHNGLQSGDTCITPTVVMRPTSGYHSSVRCEHSPDQPTTEDKTPSVDQASTRRPDIPSTCASVSARKYKCEGNNPKRSKSRYLARELADTFRKHIASNLRRSKSMKPGICQSNTEPVASQNVKKSAYQSVKKSELKLADPSQGDNGSCCESKLCTLTSKIELII
ncbi:hypothetical protein P879_02286 [Paragonimus westermani]|uniref:Uncharacterized protein n=1 Tax=Paragonimus westermani TaxID=34504 RepID=A0A8T0D5K6_9TREM|nr:hypothetical protein P879_02286 [Paragonimus westermani]